MTIARKELANISLYPHFSSLSKRQEQPLTQRHRNGRHTSDTQLPLNQPRGDGDLGDVSPEIVQGKQAAGDALAVRAHEGDGLCVVGGAGGARRGEQCGLAEDTGDEGAAEHSQEAIVPVPVDCRGDLLTRRGEERQHVVSE